MICYTCTKRAYNYEYDYNKEPCLYIIKFYTVAFNDITQTSTSTEQ